MALSNTSGFSEDAPGAEFGETHLPERGVGTETQRLAASVVETARSVAASVAGQAKEVGLHAVSELSGTAEMGVARGADAIDGIAGAVKAAAAELERTSPVLAAGAVRVADQLESLTGNIRGRSPRDLLAAAQDLARTHPVLFATGASIAGFALARFLKSGTSGVANGAVAAERPEADRFVAGE